MSTGWGKTMALVSAACYGVAMPLARLAYDHGTNALTIMTLRYLFLALVLWVWLVVAGKSLAMAPRTLAACVMIGATFVGTAGGALAAIHYMPVSLAVLVFYTYPTITLLAECALERRWPRRLEVLAVALALVGLGLTLQASLDDLDFTGVGFALIASFSAASALILSSHTLKKAGSRLIGFYACAVAFAISGLAMMGNDALSIPETPAGLSILAVVIGAFSLAVVTMFASVQRIGASRSATIFCFEPVVGIFTAILLLGEHLAPVQWLGASLVGIAILIATKRQPETKEF
jgi:drug/metabolite transporter (DMT)-like permease